jgi:hypothetical protein
LPQPRLICDPGLLSVKVATLDSENPTAFHLVLWFLEPCDAFKEPDQCN